MRINKLHLAAFAALFIGAFASCEKDEEFSDPMSLGDGKIYVVGHKSPDTDAVTSAMAYAEFLRQMGYDCEARVAGPLNAETSFIMDTFGINAPSVLNNATGLRVVLVDHSEYLQAVDGMKDATILRVVDNHKLGTVNKAASYDTTMLAGSTCTIVYDDFKKNNFTISKNVASLMIAGILSDTRRLKPGKFFPCDSIALFDLLPIAGIDSLDNFYERMHSFADKYDGLSDVEILLSDYKSYEVNGVKYGMGAVDVASDSLLPDMRARIIAAMEEYLPTSGLDFVTCKIDADTVDCTNFVYVGEMAADVMQKAFGPDFKSDDFTAELKDGYVYFLPHAGRKKLTPFIDEVLKSIDK